ncbi:MAG: RimK family alpha-L-glutamate ligase [Bacilli bacterium]|nr:RimK family alpha-L-glutamate ligase [Bacilli bacterium]
MISGLIVYSEIDASKNEWFINKCQEECSKKEISLIYKEEKAAIDYINNNHVDFVIYRARNSELLKEIEVKGIRSFNNSLTNKTANDKFLTYQFFKNNGFPCLDSFLNINEVDSYPLVMKSRAGHGGSEVFLIKNKEEASRISNSNNAYIYQKYIPNNGDVRLYVLDNKVIAAIKRKSDKDFRNNYSLGGRVEPFAPSKEMEDIAIEISKLLKADYIGVDFLLANDGYFVNEIEDPVGARMLYQTSDIDIIKLFVEYISKKVA